MSVSKVKEAASFDTDHAVGNIGRQHCAEADDAKAR
jgi:hypothetical protein